jgi:hypothetical protein
MGHNLFQIWEVETLLPLENVECLAIRTWASWLTRTAGISAQRIAEECLGVRGSTLPFAWRKKGSPRPKLVNEQGGVGPLLLIEQLAPGSLRLLLHPGWLLLCVPKSHHDAYEIACRFEPTIRSMFMQQIRSVPDEYEESIYAEKWIRSGNTNDGMADVEITYLKHFGSIDAFFGALLLRLENFYLETKHNSTLRLKQVRVDDWRCWQDTDLEIRSAAANCLDDFYNAMVARESTISSSKIAAQNLVQNEGRSCKTVEAHCLLQQISSSLEYNPAVTYDKNYHDAREWYRRD